ncbi:MAG: hypothetical protein QMD11_03130 [Smithella sp.]|nr:hypothetical protein [Smithella sp.]
MTEIILDETEDWDKRILCSDESCIGIIGADGKCRECGKPYEGVLPEDHGSEAVPPVAMEASKQIVPEAAESDDDWDNRVLCSDGTCIGVIGADGKCKECGQPLK